jgi:DNA-binding NarL/FixJ family response regulator
VDRLPLVVLEGPRGVADREAARLRASGHEVVAGFRTAVARGRQVVRVGVVAGPSDAADALLAAIDGAGLIVEATADQATIDRLVDDLRRLGPVDHRSGEANAAPPLGPEARAILGLLAEGHSLGEAAHVLGLARRTADRRLAAARTALGVNRTTEAIARARRLGWFGPGGGHGGAG